jgi:hypothetical protein
VLNKTDERNQKTERRIKKRPERSPYTRPRSGGIRNSVTYIIEAGVDMQDGFLSRLIDRLVANARAIRGSPEAIALSVIVVLGMSYLGFQH